MITRTHTAPCPEQYLLAQGLDPERVIYFDIETTGFRPSTSSLYMIGWAVRAKQNQPVKGKTQNDEACVWEVTQVLAEDRTEERALLAQFLELLSGYETIIEFNGDRFDLPYVRGKCAEYDLPDPFENVGTLDLYQLLKPYKGMLGMERLNQKSVEKFLGISRTDPYNGGQLIDVYRAYRDGTASDPGWALDALFLHNLEDVLGMLQMTPLLAYHLAFESTAPVKGKIVGAGSQRVLRASFPLSVPLPRALSCDKGDWRIEASGQMVAVVIPLKMRTLYHFFSNYRDYVFLPMEGKVVHKSVGCFVDPQFREKAKAENCCVEKTGYFLPHPLKDMEPVFRAGYREKTQWFELTDAFLESEDLLRDYIHNLMK